MVPLSSESIGGVAIQHLFAWLLDEHRTFPLECRFHKDQNHFCFCSPPHSQCLGQYLTCGRYEKIFVEGMIKTKGLKTKEDLRESKEGERLELPALARCCWKASVVRTGKVPFGFASVEVVDDLDESKVMEWWRLVLNQCGLRAVWWRIGERV